MRLGVIIVAVVVVLGLLFFYVPRYVARYLLASELADLGIDYEGIETLEINPLTREIWLGPVRFGAEPSDRGRMRELGLIIRLNPLLRRRISIERLLARGIDVVVTRTAENAFALNGIPLDQFMPPKASAGQAARDSDAWGAGVDTFELRDSRLIFQDLRRGELAVDVERLTLAEFKTWESERPARFELAARINDIQLNGAGEARPFADDVTLAIDSRTVQADVPKVVRFTGPWGLDRRDGTYDAELRHEMTLFDSGRSEGHIEGTIDVKGADYERAGAFALALERAKVDLDVRYTLSESGDFALTGQVGLDLGPTRGALADEIQFGAEAGHVAVRAIDATYEEGGALRVAVGPVADLESVTFSGPIEISVGKVLELLARLQSLSAPAPVSSADTGLGDFEERSVTLPHSDVKIGRLGIKADSFSIQSTNGRVELGLESSTDLSDIEIRANERSVDIERLQSILQRLSVVSGLGRLTLDMASKDSLVAGVAKGPKGEIKVAGIETTVNKLGLQAQTGAVSMQLAADGRATGFSSLTYAASGLPELQIHLSAADAALSQASLDAGDGALRWHAAGDAAVDALTAHFAKSEEGAIKLHRAKIDAIEISDGFDFAADALTVDGLDLYVNRSLLEALLRARKARPKKAKSTAQTDVVPLRGAGVRVGHLAMTGEPEIRFRDDLVTPQVTLQIIFEEVDVRNLDTRKTEQRTDVRIAADVNEFTHVELSGWVNGLNSGADFDLTAKVSDLELSTYSPYAVALAGVYLESGQLDTTTFGKALQGSLKGEIQLELDDITFRPLNKEDAERVKDAVGVELESAVNLLQDDEGRITLRLPVSGILTDPDVDISSAVNAAIGGVLTKVFPPTLVASILSDVSKGTAATFKPIAFAPGSAELDEAGRRYADDMAEFLAQRPKLSLKLCGRSTAQDMEHLGTTAAARTVDESLTTRTPEAAQEAQALHELAEDRQRALRRYLINEIGADPKQLPECRATFDEGDQGRPRVEILL